MSVSFSRNITNEDWQRYLNRNQAQYNTGYNTDVRQMQRMSEQDQFTSTTGGAEKCTDGKDDGKIGFFSALGNVVKGVGKTIVNGVKGMFTGKDGKFSLGKTLLSVGTAALCFAVPAVGVAACVVGGTMGAIQVGKGIYNAATADTDAEAKEAWQSIGGGAFTVAASVAGAKAGVKAVKSTSTATNGLASLGKDATLGQKAAALGRDMISSTKNQAGMIGNAVKTSATTGKGAQVSNAIKHPIQTAKNAWNTGKNMWKTAKGAVTKENAQVLWDGIKAKAQSGIDSAKSFKLSTFVKSLPQKAQNIWSELSTGNLSYQEAVSKYGYESVAEVIQYMGGTLYSTENI